MPRDNEIRTRLILEGEDDGATDVLEDIGEEVEDLADDIDDASGEISSSFRDAFGEAKSNIAGGLKEGFTGALEFAGDSIKETARFAVNVFGDQIGNGLVALGVDPELAMNVQRFTENMTELVLGPLGNALSAGVGKLGGILGPAMASAATPVIAAMGPIFTTIGTAVGSLMTTAIALAPLLLPALLIAAIVAAIALIIHDPSIPGKALDIGVGIVRGILEGMAGLAKAVLDVFLLAVGGILRAAIDFAWDIVELFLQLGRDIVEGVADFVTKVVGEIVAIPGRLVAFVVSIVDLFAGIGSDIIDGVGELVGDIVGEIMSIPGKLVAFASEVIGKILAPLQGVLDVVGSIVEDLQKALNLSQDPRFQENITGSNRPQHRALGGPVMAGSSYIVGEHGAELFVPTSNGTIIPNGGGGGNTYVLQVSGIQDPEQWSARALRALDRRMRREGLL